MKYLNSQAKIQTSLCLLALAVQLVIPGTITADITNPGTIDGSDALLSMYQETATTFPIADPGELTCGWFGSVMYRQSLLRYGVPNINYQEIKHWSANQPLPDSLTWDGRGDDGRVALAGIWSLSISFHTITNGQCDTSTQQTYNHYLYIYPHSQVDYQYSADPKEVEPLFEGHGGYLQYNGPQRKTDQTALPE